MSIRPIVRLITWPFRATWYILSAFLEAMKWALIATNPLLLAIYLYRQWERDQKKEAKS